MTEEIMCGKCRKVFPGYPAKYCQSLICPDCKSLGLRPKYKHEIELLKRQNKLMKEALKTIKNASLRDFSDPSVDMSYYAGTILMNVRKAG